MITKFKLTKNDVVKGSNIKTSNMYENYKQFNTCFAKWPISVLADLTVVSSKSWVQFTTHLIPQLKT